VTGLSDPVVQQTLYILLAAVVLLMLVVLVVAWRLLVVRGRCKTSQLVTKQQILNSHADDIHLKVTPIGDSTLNVRDLCTLLLELLYLCPIHSQ